MEGTTRLTNFSADFLLLSTIVEGSETGAKQVYEYVFRCRLRVPNIAREKWWVEEGDFVRGRRLGGLVVL